MFPIEEEGKFKNESPQSPKILDPETILNQNRALIESYSSRLTEFKNPSNFDFP